MTQNENALPPFIHLRSRSQYSMLQGAIHVEELVDKVVELGMPAVAVTDTDGLFGALDFYLQAKQKKIKPILGVTLHTLEHGYPGLLSELATTSAKSQNKVQTFKPKAFEIVALCKSQKGYENLCRLISEGYLNVPPPQKGQPALPKFLVTQKQIDEMGDELIWLSSGLRSEMGYLFLTGQEDEALKKARWFKERFKENFYFEIQDHGLPEQDLLNETFFSWGERLGIPCVGTVDCHYLTPEASEAHELLQCIENGRNLDFERPKSLVPKEFYLKSSAVMRERLAKFPGAFENTQKIADLCQFDFKFKDEQGRPIYHLPDFRPDGVRADEPFDTIQFFRDASREGLATRFASKAFARKRALPHWDTLKIAYGDRLAQELAMIEKTGFAGYFLIVSDFIKWAKTNRIPVGPGRGSGAGSLVAYSLMITDIDPIEFNLLFERFINPERISMPDFDIDFCQDRRQEVIEYVEQKYGKDNVSQIITFGKLQARAVLKDVSRVLGLSFAEADDINKLLPEELGITIEAAIAKEPRIRDRIESDRKARVIFDYALKLEGLFRNAGVHAAGVIITQKPILNYCPIYVGKDQARVTQFDKDASEKIGLIKFDFLGLKTLTVIDNAIKLIQNAQEFDLEAMDYFDQKVFDLISSGDTDGVFQVESSGMKDLCSRIKPSSIEDLTAINALYRPGPLGSGMVDDFIDRKHGRTVMVFELPELEAILKETYGVILYQEQVMQIARELAGYSLGQADLLRRAMGKKKADEMAAHREIFVKGCVERKFRSETASKIFDLMAKFAEYGFNKSHSAAYGLLTYQTAYLKAHFPCEFMAALMTTEINDTDKITRYIADTKLHDIKILPPDVNFSQKQFSVEKQDGVSAVRFGLEAIKGVGGVAVDSILEARAAGGAFANTLDFVRRVSPRKVNKKVMESLIYSGALDTIAEVNRPSLLASVEKLLEVASDEQAERELGQTSLFDAFSAQEIKMVTPLNLIFKQEADWPRAKLLIKEKETVGFYVSGHPMDPWQSACEDWLKSSCIKIKEMHEKAVAKKAEQKTSEPADEGYGRRKKHPEIKLAGLISEKKEITTKKGARMAFMKIEDLGGNLEVIFFPESYARLQTELDLAVAETTPVVLSGELDLTGEAPKILVQKCERVETAYQARSKRVILHLDLRSLNKDKLRDLKGLFLKHRGRSPVEIFLENPPAPKARLTLNESYFVMVSPPFLEEITQSLGTHAVELKDL